MEQYQSKELSLEQSAEAVYERLSRLDALTPYLTDKLESWTADQDACSFRVQGFPVSLRIAEKVPGRLIRLEPNGATPMNFGFRIALSPLPEQGCTMQLTLEVELNTMLRMMVGSKLQSAVDQMAQAAAQAINASTRGV